MLWSRHFQQGRTSMSRKSRPRRALAVRLHQLSRKGVAALIWAAFALLMVAIGVGRVADHRPFGSWFAFVASAVVAGFYAYWLSGRLTKGSTWRADTGDQK
jgi:hypothetical protein